jgi:hypothetical protein
MSLPNRPGNCAISMRCGQFEETVQRLGGSRSAGGKQALESHIGAHDISAWPSVPIEVKSICYGSGINRNRGLRVTKQG